MPDMDYSLIHRTPDGNGKILVTTPGSPDKGSWESEAELKTYVNQDVVMQTDIVQSLGQQIDKVPSNKAVDDAINAINTRVTNIEETLMGENEVTVQYPNDGDYSSLMPNKVPARALKFAEVPTIRGKTRAWNQFINPLNFPSVEDSFTNGVRVSAVDTTNGTITITVDTGGATALRRIDINLDTAIPAGHSRLLLGSAKSGSTSTYATNVYGTGGGTGLWDTGSGAVNAGVVDSLFIGIVIFQGCPAGTYVFRPCLYDLALILPEYTSAQLETLGVSGVLSLLPALGQYDAYDAGSLVDTVVSGVEAISVNLIDEATALSSIGFAKIGDYWQSQTTVKTLPTSISWKPLTRYTISFKGKVSAVGVNFRFRFEYTDGTYSQYGYVNSTSEISAVHTSDSGKTVSRVYTYYGNDGTVYIRDLQIEEGATVTAFVPYKHDILMLSSPVTLRSAGSVAEVLDVETGKKTRPVGSVTISNSNLSDPTDNGNRAVFEITTPEQVKYSNSADVPNMLMAGFVAVSQNTTWSAGQISMSITNPNKVFVIMPTGTTKANMLSLHNGDSILYELATPLSDEQVCDPIPDNFLKVECGGTVETIQTQTPVIDNCLDVTYDIIPQ